MKSSLIRGAVICALGGVFMMGCRTSADADRAGPEQPAAVDSTGPIRTDDTGTSSTEPPSDGPPGPIGSSAANRLPAVAVGEDADLGVGLVASVVRIEPVDVDGAGPGETTGPGVLVETRLVNISEEPVDLSPVVVNAELPDGEIGIPATGAASAPHHGLLAPHAIQSGTYLFRLDGHPTGVIVDVQHGGAENVLVVHA